MRSVSHVLSSARMTHEKWAWKVLKLPVLPVLLAFSFKYQIAVSRLFAKYTDTWKMSKISTEVIVSTVSDFTSHCQLFESLFRLYNLLDENIDCSTPYFLQLLNFVAWVYLTESISKLCEENAALCDSVEICHAKKSEWSEKLQSHICCGVSIHNVSHGLPSDLAAVRLRAHSDRVTQMTGSVAE